MTKKENLKIHQLNIAGADILAEIYHLAFQNMQEQVWDAQTFKELFEIEGTSSYILEKNTQPLGFIMLRKLHDEVEIITFCILPKWCNNGYATFLLEWMIRRLQKQKIKRVFLEVRENNEAAKKLYNKCCFRKVGRRAGYYNNLDGKKIDALVMQLELRE